MSLLRRRMMMQTEGDEDMKEWRILNDIVLESEGRTFDISQDMDGNGFACDEIILFLKSVGTESNAGVQNANALLLFNGEQRNFYINSIGMGSGVTRTLELQAGAKPLHYNAFILNSANDSSGGGTIQNMAGYSFDDPIEKINAVKIQLQAMYFSVGSRLKIYGR